jgi:alkanesulfonate monooxygenase SsuD/methylene tetrahydromethanopterin reductase-like flavin-dependent oxidoreductase (luciferase family)
MRFGLFGSAQARRGGPDVDSGAGFREFVENNVEAEALGYHSTFLVEHHFTGFGQVSATLNLLTWVGARTTTLRLGTAVMVLAWHNPVLLAEQAATLDLLSGGRLDFGIGKGYRYNEFSGFAMPMEEADERFDESRAVIVKAWTSDTPWSHAGKYWRFDGVVVEPPPAQRPHPPLWMGAGSPASIKKVAALGDRLLLDQFASVDEVRDRIALFKSEVRARGGAFDPMSVGVTRSINIVDTDDELERAMQARIAGRRRIDRLANRPGDADSRALSDGELRAAALYGTPDVVAAKVQALRDAGVEYLLLNSAGGIRSLRRFAREVMPAFSQAPALAASA